LNGSSKIKVDFNLLQSGTWVLEKRGTQRIHYFEKELEGGGKIIIYNALDVPSPLDSKVLDYLMLKSQENDWIEEIMLGSLRQIASEIWRGKLPNNKKLERLKKSFKILANTRIEFENCFIDTGILEHFESGYWQTISIGILADYGFIPLKTRGNPLGVKVVFDKNFIALCRYSLGYKLIPYAPINGLRDTAYALYKWAFRWYDSEKGYGERWIGDGKKLVEWYKNELNSVAQYKYPSEVLRRLKSAIKQLNENKEVPFALRLKEENGSHKIEIYRKEGVTLRREVPFDTLPYPIRKAIIKLLNQRKDIKEPYALARSMSWKEIENWLEKLVVLEISNWDFVKEMLEWGKELKTFESETLVIEEKGEKEAVIVFEKSKLRKGYIAQFFKAFPNLKTFLYPAKDWTRGEKILKGSAK